MFNSIRQVYFSNLTSLAHAHNARDIFSGTSTSLFLFSSKHKGFHPSPLLNIKETGSLRAIEFMSRSRKQINTKFFNINIDLANGLHSISVKIDPFTI